MSWKGQTKEGFTLFYKAGCPYSAKARNTLIEHFGGSGSFKEICVDNNPEGWKRSISSMTGGKRIQTFPQIFCGGQHIGGYTDLQNYCNSRQQSAGTTFRRMFGFP